MESLNGDGYGGGYGSGGGSGDGGGYGDGSGDCSECGQPTDNWDSGAEDWICEDCNAELVAGQERDKALDDPRRGQAADINK